MAGIMTKAVSMFLVAAVMIMVVAPQGEAAVGCGMEISFLSSCIPYVTDKGPIGGDCCNGVRSLHSAAETPAERQNVCSCLKLLADQYAGLDHSRVDGFSGQCGVNVPYQISPSTDCSKVD